MKSRWINFLPIFLVLFLVSACTGEMRVSDGEQYEDTFPSQFLFDDVYILKNRERIDGNIAGIGTRLIIEEGATVTGSISLIDGQLDILGNIKGDINVFLGTTNIGASSTITGDINQAANQLNIEPGARVLGKINTFLLPDEAKPVDETRISNAIKWIRPSVWIIFETIRNLSLIFINLLIVFLFKSPTLKVTRTITSNLALSWGIGLLIFIALPLVSLALIISICLSPIGLILMLAYLIANVWAWTGISLIIGKIFTKWLKVEWTEEAKITVGSVFLGLISTLLAFLPLIGFSVNVIVSAIGIGGIFLSKIGTAEKIN